METKREREEQKVEVSWEVADACNGFAMDFGECTPFSCYILQQDYQTILKQIQ